MIQSNLADSFCGYCGVRLPETSVALETCPSCSTEFRDSRPTAVPPPPPSPTFSSFADEDPPRSRDPAIASIFGVVLPGAGQVYNGQFFKGLFVFATCWLVVPWLFGILDAYITAKRSHPIGRAVA